MRCYTLSRALLLQVLICNVLAANIRSIFLFKDVLKSNTTAIKTSGFNSLIIFGVGVIDNGDISEQPSKVFQSPREKQSSIAWIIGYMTSHLEKLRWVQLVERL